MIDEQKERTERCWNFKNKNWNVNQSDTENKLGI